MSGKLWRLACDDSQSRSELSVVGFEVLNVLRTGRNRPRHVSFESGGSLNGPTYSDAVPRRRSVYMHCSLNALHLVQGVPPEHCLRRARHLSHACVVRFLLGRRLLAAEDEGSAIVLGP